MSSSCTHKMGRALEVCAAKGTARRAPWACNAHVSSPEATSPEKAASIGVGAPVPPRACNAKCSPVFDTPSKKRTGFARLAHFFPFEPLFIFKLNTSIEQVIRQMNCVPPFASPEVSRYRHGSYDTLRHLRNVECASTDPRPAISIATPATRTPRARTLAHARIPRQLGPAAPSLILCNVFCRRVPCARVPRGFSMRLRSPACSHVTVQDRHVQAA